MYICALLVFSSFIVFDRRLIRARLVTAFSLYNEDYVDYWPLTELSIRDFWDRMFQMCKQEDSSRGLTSGSRSHESRTGRTHWRYEIIYTRIPTSDGLSHRVTVSQVGTEAALGATRSKWQWPHLVEREGRKALNMESQYIYIYMQGSIKYHFSSLWYDLSPVSWTIAEHSTRRANMCKNRIWH